MNPGQSFITDVSRQIIESSDIVALLVYGSYATGKNDSSSDMDLIGITKDRSGHQFMTEINKVSIDVYVGTSEFLEQSLRSDIHTNNNFTLFALSHGKILIDHIDSLKMLTALAKELWVKGPVQPSVAEQQSIAYAVQKASISAKKFINRIEQSVEMRNLANTQVSYIFIQIVYAYCRIHRLWSSAIWEMIKWTDFKYIDLVGLCRKYLQSDVFEDRISTLTLLADLTISKINLNLRK